MNPLLSLFLVTVITSSPAMSQSAITADPRSDDAHVRAVLIQTQREVKDYTGSGLLGLQKKDAPTLLRLLPQIEVPWVAQCAAYDLATWRVKASIPVLVSLLDREGFGRAIGPVLSGWGWLAVADLLQEFEHGSFRGRLAAAQILTSECRERPEDQRLTTIFLKISRSQSAEFRRAASVGLANLAYRTESWMEMTHPSTMDNAAAFERLLEMTSDPDPEVARGVTYSIHYWLWSRHQGPINNPGYEERPDIFPVAESKNLSILVGKGSNAYDRAAALALLHRAWPGQHPEFVAPLSDTDPFVQRVAVYLMKGRLSVQFLPDIAKIAKFGSDSSRYSAAVVLGRSYLLGALDILKPMLQDSSPPVRGAASAAVDRIEGGRLRG